MASTWLLCGLARVPKFTKRFKRRAMAYDVGDGVDDVGDVDGEFNDVGDVDDNGGDVGDDDDDVDVDDDVEGVDDVDADLDDDATDVLVMWKIMLMALMAMLLLWRC